MAASPDCWTTPLELDDCRKITAWNLPGRVAQIDSPLGIYDASVYPSPRLDGEAVLLLGNTGLMTAVEIHPGNIPKDTKGCILPETTQSKDFVGNSQADARGAAPQPLGLALENLALRQQLAVWKARQPWPRLTRSKPRLLIISAPLTAAVAR